VRRPITTDVADIHRQLAGVDVVIIIVTILEPQACAGATARTARMPLERGGDAGEQRVRVHARADVELRAHVPDGEVRFYVARDGGQRGEWVGVHGAARYVRAPGDGGEWAAALATAPVLRSRRDGRGCGEEVVFEGLPGDDVVFEGRLAFKVLLGRMNLNVNEIYFEYREVALGRSWSENVFRA